MSDHYIDGKWVEGIGDLLLSTNPATQEEIWRGHEATEQEIEKAVQAADDAFDSWSSLSFKQRALMLKKVQEKISYNFDLLAETISKETGKPLWEAKTEVNAMIGKVDLSIEAYQLRCPHTATRLPAAKLHTRFKPHGPLAVLGPYNFPGHIPNGHIIPALLAGNTLVFKPSEWTPLVGALLASCFSKLPTGVINLIQGGPQTASHLLDHTKIKGVLFTGSFRTGQSIAIRLAANPGKLLALEMGGNNPLVIGAIRDIKAAAYLTVQSAFITSGQRCSCARRLILTKHVPKEFLDTLKAMTLSIKVGPYTRQPEPFMGPLIHRPAAEQVLAAEKALIDAGATSLVPVKEMIPFTPMLTPGIIDVTTLERNDEEVFGPLLQVIHVEDFDEALIEANRTAYGLSAGLISDSEEEWSTFFKKVRAGVVNWNTPLTGASGRAPFGGIGHSGNLRPSAFFAADYCAYPIASTEVTKVCLPTFITPGVEL
ncbi:MAG: succinylglutamate-semialdehyde dehydrogenase [Chlamydiia bacterium]|nr:succinylglutamate-semialdehyde dehydrogenase [Chlamydiia bacterium]